MQAFLSLYLVAAVINADIRADWAHMESHCYLPLDVMFLQDTTGSFEDDLPNVVKQLPDMVNTIGAQFPNSNFGVAEFKDKPYFPLGIESDFCYKLGEGKLSSSLDDFNWAYSGLYASGGGDLPEAQFQALINIGLDANVGWRPLASPGSRATDGQAGARVVIMSTDAQPHLPGDIQKLLPDFPDLPSNLPPNAGNIVQNDVDYACLHQDYPTPEQARAILKSQNIYLTFLIGDADNDNPAALPAWKWVNEDLLGQPSDFLQVIKSDSSDLLEGVLAAVKSVTETACLVTTPQPDTTVSTTAATTVSSTAATTVSTTASTVITTASTVSSTVSASSSVSSTVSSTVKPTVEPEGSTESVTSAPNCPGCCCPSCPHPCPDDCPAKPCNEGVIVKISNKPTHVNITIE